MLLAEVHNPTNIRLTSSDTDGIFLHFDAGEKQVGIRLDNPNLAGSEVASAWAKQQLAEQLCYTDMKRRLKAHSAGEAVRHFCRDCLKAFWNVDDEPMICPHCGSKDMPIIDPDAEQIA